MSKPFDYIIIGAGSAGCILANRLSQDSNNRVLLLEAGPSSFALSQIPGAYIKLFKTKIDWQYSATPQPHVNNRVIYLPRGKVLGGCSTTNAMAYVRGNKRDYDGWAAAGNEGWSYEDILPYFRKSERVLSPDLTHDRYRGTSGELPVGFNDRFSTPFSEAFIASGVQMGYERLQDYNAEKQAGFAHFQFTIKNGKRYSSAEAFIKPIKSRKNLTILTGVLVEKILIQKDTATGVQVSIKGQRQTFEANKEIILSAGAYNSPQLLMLSGIGDPEELKRHQIELVKDLPGVGKNLQDHLFFPVSALTKSKKGLNHYGSITGQLKALGQYLLSKKGPLTIGPLEAVGFVDINGQTDTPDFQFHFAPLHIGGNYGFDMYDIGSLPTDVDGVTILPSLLHPKSRGAVSLRSANASEMPMIDPNLLSNEEDLQTLVKGGKMALQLFEKSPLSEQISSLLFQENMVDEASLMDHIKKTLETIYHPVGTCKMGNDEMAVVDASLRVKGIDKLRVADASIMPSIVTGNTNAPVYMIAEKAADMILPH